MEIQKKSDITKERLLSELSAILEAKITDYLDFTGRRIKFKPFSELTESQIRAIESIKKGRNGIELKLYGKSWTIDRISKMLGYEAPIKTEVDGNINSDINLNLSVLSTEELTVYNKLLEKLNAKDK